MKYVQGIHFQFELAGNLSYRAINYRDVTVLESLKHVNMGMERWGFLFSVVSSPIVYFLKKTRAVCQNINPIMLCTHVCDVNYAACYCECYKCKRHRGSEADMRGSIKHTHTHTHSNKRPLQLLINASSNQTCFLLIFQTGLVVKMK